MGFNSAFKVLICSSPLCFSNVLGGFVGFGQYKSIFLYVYISCMSRGRHVSASLILGHLSGPSITLLFAMPGMIWLFS